MLTLLAASLLMALLASGADAQENRRIEVVPKLGYPGFVREHRSTKFVTFLHDIDPAGFARMLDAILDDRSFAEAVTTGYGIDLQALWLRFAQAQSTP